MARRKRTAALFEVINRGNPERPAPLKAGVVGNVGSWIGGSSGSSAAAIAAPVVTPMAAPSVEAGGMLDLDDDRQEVAFRLSYTAAAIAIFTVATAIGAAFIAGKKLANPGIVNAAATNNVDPRLGPVQVDVTDLPRTPVVMPNVANRGEAKPAARPATPAPQPEARQVNAVGSVVNGRNRKVGYQYVVIQSYPDAKLADEARKILAEGGVEATVETGVPGWGRWHCVMGTTGFEKLANNGQYDAYLRKIRQISQSYAKKGSFKEFAPTPTRWDPKKTTR